MVNCTATDAGDECEANLSEKAQVLFALAVVVLLGVALFFAHKRWVQLEQRAAKATGVLNEASMYAQYIARHFSPSMKVAKYQFRGMQAPKHPIDIAFMDLGLKIKTGVKVLNGVNGEFKAGSMCAIMGPSGAGKTTFMNVLCGKATYGTMTGKCLINGHNFDIRQISSVVGFVPQDDIVHETLSVREQIRFSAALRNKVGTSQDRIERITDDVLNVMQIDHIQNTIVGGVRKRGISGGQRKRVNIGLELAAQPTVLFLDEPTTGLDSTSSLSVVYSLKKMCQLGMSCIMVIHQPRYALFTLFDDVLLLGKGGHAVYLGGSLGASDYFKGLGFVIPENENMADWFMDVISGEVTNPKMPDFTPKMLFDFWEKYEKESGASNGKDANSNEASDEDDETRMSNFDQMARMMKTFRIGGRASMTEDEDVAVLVRNLQEEWDRIDKNGDGYLDTDELTELLTACANVSPSDEVVEELMKRMGGSRGVVTRAEFVEYCKTMKNDVAAEHIKSIDEEDESPSTPSNTLGHMGQRFSLMKMRLRSSRTSVRAQALDAGAESSSGSSGTETDEETAFTGKASMILKLQRRVPDCAIQFHTLFTRNVIQWWRMNPSRLIFFAAMTLGAIVLALQDWTVGNPQWDAMVFVSNHTCVALLVSIYSLQTFGDNQPVFWRERNRGLNVLAYGISRTNLNLVDSGMMCFMFTATYYVLRDIEVGFFVYWLPYLLVAFAASGWGYCISAWFPYKHGPFIDSLLIFVTCGILGNPFNLAKFLKSPTLEAIVSLLSITRWSIPMSFLMQERLTHPHPAPGQQEELFKQYESALTAGNWAIWGSWYSGIVALLTMGVVLRLITFAGLAFKNLDKQV